MHRDHPTATPGLTRRAFLGAAGATVVAACTGSGAPDDPTTTTTSSTTTTSIPLLDPIDHGAPVGENPFSLGVASGDPSPTSVVLWTRVDRAVPVLVEVALDETFDSIVSRSDVLADEDADRTVRVLAADLLPDRRYWYRFVADGHVTPAARTRTAPAPGTTPAEPLRVGQVSCQRWSSGYYTAFADLAAQAPDLVVHCGDAVYENDGGPVRPLDLAKGTDLESWRAIWRAYRTDPDFQAALAVAPFVFTWDDHEVENNHQGDTPGGRDGVTGDPAYLERRAAAYRAWWEYTPTTAPPPDGPAATMRRVVPWGDLVTFVALDSRQHRDEQPCGDAVGIDLGDVCDDAATTTMLGDAQERWLAEEVSASAATWTSLVNQVMVMPWKLAPGTYNLDGWDGYPGARRRLLETLAGAANPVVLTGDVHSSWVGTLEDDDGERVGVEFVTPGVSSAVPDQLRGLGSLVELQNGHLAWSETERRGWVLHEITDAAWTAEYRLVADAEAVGSSVATASTWQVDEGARRPTRTDR